MGETALIFFSLAVAARDRRLQEYFIWAFFLGKHRTPRPHTHKCNSTHNHSHIIAFFQEETDYPVLRCRSDIRICAQLSLPLSSYTITLPTHYLLIHLAGGNSKEYCIAFISKWGRRKQLSQKVFPTSFFPPLKLSQLTQWCYSADVTAPSTYACFFSRTLRRQSEMLMRVSLPCFLLGLNR